MTTLIVNGCAEEIAALEGRLREQATSAISASTASEGLSTARQARVADARERDAPVTSLPHAPDPGTPEAKAAERAEEAGGGGDRVMQAKATRNRARTLDQPGNSTGCLEAIGGQASARSVMARSKWIDTPGGAVRRVLSLLICLTIPSLNARADEIRGLVTIGMQRVFEEVRPAFETASGRRLHVQFASSPDIAERVQEGEAADFIIISRTAADGLINRGTVPASNRFVLGGSSITVAVPAGRPKPDVSTPERLRSALLAAQAIAYTDPASGGPSGIQFAKVLEHLGIAEQVRPKTKFPPAGGFVGEILARGEADIGIQQSTELSSFRGVDVVGLLPSEFQIVTDYAAAIPANAVHPEAGKALVEFMRSAEGAAAMKAKGLDPK
jgi:molybdate transport system substrate-binding protein